MDELERDLTVVLTRVGEQVDPGFARLRNPAHDADPAGRPGPARPGRTRTRWTVAASGLAVAAMALGITVVAPQLQGDPKAPVAPAAPSPSSSQAPSPSQSATPAPVGKADGDHPLWPLTLAPTPARSYKDLPPGKQVVLPVPRTLDPRLTSKADGAPTLVTAAGTIRFSPRESKSVTLLARRDQGLFVVLNGAGNDGQDGFYDARFVLVAPDNSRRQIHRTATATSFIVSPNGTLLAVNTGRAIELVDVVSGEVEQEMPGQLEAVSWISEDTLLVSAEDNQSSRMWRAPWTSATQPTSLPGGVQITAAGELVQLDSATGCLQKIDTNARVTATNCAGWRTTPGATSPDGRYLPLEWTTSGTVRRGVLDTVQNQIRTWPVNGWDPAWLGPDDVLLPEADARDSPGTARCTLSTATCSDVADGLGGQDWSGVSWLSGR